MPRATLLLSVETRNSLDCPGRRSCRLARYGPRIVNIELDDLAGKGCGGHQGHAFRGVKAVPSTLWVDSNHAGAEREGPGRPAIANDFQGRGAVEDVNQFVAREMAFPMTFPGEFCDEQAAVSIGSQSSAAALSVRDRRLRGPAAEHRQLLEFRVEIDDAGRSARHDPLWLCRPRVVDIELDVVAGKRRAPGRPALRRAKAVPRALWHDRDHSGANLEGLRRTVVADNVEDLHAVENVNQLVLGMIFPMACPRVLAGEEDTVAVGAQLRRTAPALRPCRCR